MGTRQCSSQAAAVVSVLLSLSSLPVEVSKSSLPLAPFGVQVVEVITGYVQSNILRSGLQVSPGSWYTTIKYHIENLKVQGNQRGMPASEYAWRVLEQIMQEKPPIEFWEGAGARSVRIITSWLPLWLSVSISPLLCVSPRSSVDDISGQNLVPQVRAQGTRSIAVGPDSKWICFIS